MSLPRLVWTTSPDGRDQQVWTDAPEVDVDLSDLTPAPAWARTTTHPIDEAALADLLQRSRAR